MTCRRSKKKNKKQTKNKTYNQSVWARFTRTGSWQGAWRFRRNNRKPTVENKRKAVELSGRTTECLTGGD